MAHLPFCHLWVGTDGAGPGDPLSPPQALGPAVPTKGLVSSWCGSHLRLSKRWILARCAPSTAREDSRTRPGGSEPAGQGVLPRAAWLTSLEHPMGVLAGSCFCLNAGVELQVFSPAPQQCRAGDGCISCTCAPWQHQSCPAPGTGALGGPWGAQDCWLQSSGSQEQGGNDPSPLPSRVTFPRTEPSIRALTFSGDLRCLR